MAFAAASVALAAAAQAQPADASPESLPEGPGREETFYGCVGCHNFAIVAQQGMSRERWDDVLRVMTERHGMPDYDGEMRALILDYLAKHYPPRRRAPANPFLP